MRNLRQFPKTEPYSIPGSFKHERVTGSLAEVIVKTTCLKCDEYFFTNLHAEALAHKENLHLAECKGRNKPA